VSSSLEETVAAGAPGSSVAAAALEVTRSAAQALASTSAAFSGRSPHGRVPVPAYGEIERGVVVGRYVVLSKLGAGAMGVVYAAYDPELDRKVALKLLQPGRELDHAARSEAANARLLREAQALAKLAHPNIVAIHDVGTLGQRVWLAMEFVAGKTLSEWLAAQQRGWREVVDVIAAASRGLAAAHAAGLLHRDLKPDNLMVGDDGRVRVMDFGLARTQGDPTPGERDLAFALDDTVLRPELEALAVKMTQTGSLTGTPAYMAKELFEARDATAQSDQFALCVTLWEALYGERPFAGDTLVELMAAVVSGDVRPVPRSGRAVPRWLERVCRRGLSPTPAHRHASIDALLAELERGQKVARRGRLLAGMAVVAGLTVAGVGAQQWDVARRTAACVAAGQGFFAQAWSEAAQRRLREGLLATGVPSAATVVDKTLPWLDQHATAWAQARTGVCMDADLRGSWPEPLRERALWCLDERQLAFEALVAELSGADKRTVYKATTAAAQLRSVEACRDADRLGRLPEPPADRARVTEVRKALAKSQALAAAGKYAEALALTEPALEQAGVMAWPSLLADAGAQRGALLEKLGRYDEAEVALSDAYFEAVKSETRDTAADAATALVFVVGVRLAKADQGKAWGRHADGALVVLGEADDAPRRANVVSSLGNVENTAGAYEAAKTLYERALAIREAALGPEHPEVATSLTNLGNVYSSTGAYDEAKQLHMRALAIKEAALGPEHPDVATSLSNLGNVHYNAGGYDAARQLYERALAIWEAAMGPEHPVVATALTNLGNVDYSAGRYEAAKQRYERALGIWEAALGPEHPAVAASLNNLAAVHLEMAAFDEAMQLLARALGIWERALGPEHPQVALGLATLGDVHREAGSYEAAKDRYARALRVWEAALGPAHPHLGYALTGLAQIAIMEAQPGEAIALAERAVKVRVDGSSAAPEIAASRFALAQALWAAPLASGRDRPRARALALEARDAFATATGQAKRRAEVDAWLAAHAGVP
jgi:tetratricopeptide (TPR) repeat protein/tRNA A-37 threonylcarbamoyl transferase component Bud32